MVDTSLNLAKNCDNFFTSLPLDVLVKVKSQAHQEGVFAPMDQAERMFHILKEKHPNCFNEQASSLLARLENQAIEAQASLREALQSKRKLRHS